MGLMLSIIVSCVGVLELFAFYTNVRRAVTAGEAHPTNASDLSCITGSYIRDLNRERNKLLEEIRRLENSKEIAVGSSDRHEERVSINTNSDLAPIKEKHVSRIFPTYTESHPIVVTDASEVSIISEPSTFHRESSPFPSYDRIAPRHSICSELVENPVVSVYEIDEENYRSPISSEAPSPEDYLKSNFDSPQYWHRRSHSRSHSRSRSRTPEISNKDLENKEYSNSNDLLLHVPNIKSSKRTEETKRSSSSEYVSVSTEFVEQTQLRRPESPFQKIVELQPSAEPEVTVVEPEEDNKDEFDKNVLNSVDGLKSKQVEEHRRQFKNKKKGKKNEVVERTTQEAAGPSSSGSNPEPFWLIFSGEYTKAMNKDWHGQHFCCWQCDESLTGQRYVLRDEHPYCVSCYESVFANGCEKCNKIIGIDSKDLSYKDKHWHEACFLCTACGESLVDKQFGSRSDRIYCGKCYDEKFASRCDGCSEIFRAGKFFFCIFSI